MSIFFNNLLSGLTTLTGNDLNKQIHTEANNSFNFHADIDSSILNCYEIIERYQSMQLKKDEVDLKQLFRTEMIKMAYLISLADGRLEKSELTTISNIFSIILTEEKLKENYYEDCSCENNFFTRVPEFIKIIAKLEKTNQSSYQENLTDTRFLYITMKQFAHVVMLCEGYRMKLEVAMINQLMNITVHYINNIENDMDLVIQKKFNNNAENFSVNGIEGIKEMNDILSEIDSLIGLDNVKKEIHNLVNLLIVRKIREDKGLNKPSVAMHLVFTGNPGTGKTMIARKIAQIYKYLGILEKGTFIEADRSSLVAGYIGQTAAKVHNLCKNAFGGILFIDEAYSLTDPQNNDDFGQEAVNTLLKIMEDQRENFIVIVAGYPKPMENFLNSNPGLRSRFNRHIHFDDYSIEELYQIFINLCEENDYTIGEGVQEDLLESIQNMMKNGGPNFANAREIRNYFDKVCSNQANRVISMQQGEMKSFTTIIKEDL